MYIRHNPVMPAHTSFAIPQFTILQHKMADIDVVNGACGQGITQYYYSFQTIEQFIYRPTLLKTMIHLHRNSVVLNIYFRISLGRDKNKWGK